VPDEFDSALRDAMKKVATALKGANVPFALSGGYASWARGGPEPVHDVDFVLLEDDVPRAVAVLEGAGMRIAEPPEDWLVKGLRRRLPRRPDLPAVRAARQPRAAG
jgi:hypothetical protein